MCIDYDTIQFEQTLRKRIEQASYGATFEGRPRLNLSMIATLCIKTFEELPKKYTRQISSSEKYPTCSDTLIGFVFIRVKYITEIWLIFMEQFQIILKEKVILLEKILENI